MFFSFIMIYNQPFHTSIKMKLAIQVTFVVISQRFIDEHLKVTGKLWFFKMFLHIKITVFFLNRTLLFFFSLIPDKVLFLLHIHIFLLGISVCVLFYGLFYSHLCKQLPQELNS